MRVQIPPRVFLKIVDCINNNASAILSMGYKYTDDEFIAAWTSSSSVRQVLGKIGLREAGAIMLVLNIRQIDLVYQKTI